MLRTVTIDYIPASFVKFHDTPDINTEIVNGRMSKLCVPLLCSGMRESANFYLLRLVAWGTVAPINVGLLLQREKALTGDKFVFGDYKLMSALKNNNLIRKQTIEAKIPMCRFGKLRQSEEDASWFFVDDSGQRTAVSTNIVDALIEIDDHWARKLRRAQRPAAKYAKFDKKAGRMMIVAHLGCRRGTPHCRSDEQLGTGIADRFFPSLYVGARDTAYYQLIASTKKEPNKASRALLAFFEMSRLDATLDNVRQSDRTSLDQFRRSLLSVPVTQAGFAIERFVAHPFVLRVADNLLFEHAGEQYTSPGPVAPVVFTFSVKNVQKPVVYPMSTYAALTELYSLSSHYHTDVTHAKEKLQSGKDFSSNTPERSALLFLYGSGLSVSDAQLQIALNSEDLQTSFQKIIDLHDFITTLTIPSMQPLRKRTAEVLLFSEPPALPVALPAIMSSSGADRDKEKRKQSAAAVSSDTEQRLAEIVKQLRWGTPFMFFPPGTHILENILSNVLSKSHDVRTRLSDYGFAQDEMMAYDVMFRSVESLKLFLNAPDYLAQRLRTFYETTSIIARLASFSRRFDDTEEIVFQFANYGHFSGKPLTEIRSVLQLFLAKTDAIIVTSEEEALLITNKIGILRYVLIALARQLVDDPLAFGLGTLTSTLTPSSSSSSPGPAIVHQDVAMAETASTSLATAVASSSSSPSVLDTSVKEADANVAPTMHFPFTGSSDGDVDVSDEPSADFSNWDPTLFLSPQDVYSAEQSLLDGYERWLPSE